MLTFKNLCIENFGPYKGRQTINLEHDSGVSIIFGENMRGKTQLLNAFRYALFGKILSRDSSREMSLHLAGNWEESKEGKYGFKVTLGFQHNGMEYELTRECSPINSSRVPETDDDYEENVFLKCNSNVVSPAEKDKILNHVMSEKVSRFFLFDGELLQQYEELLLDDSDVGRGIKDAIEKILGVPILTNGRIDLKENHRLAQSAFSRAAQKDQKTEELGTYIDSLTVTRDAHISEIERLHDEIKKLKENKYELEIAVKKDEKIRTLFGEKERLDEKISDINEDIQEKQETLKSYMDEAWLFLLKGNIDEKRKELEKEKEVIETYRITNAKTAEMVEIITQSLNKRICQICDQKLNQHTADALRETLNLITDKEQHLDNSDRLQKIISSLEMIKGFQISDISDTINLIVRSIEDLIIERAVKTDRIKEIDEDTRKYDNSEVRRTIGQYEKIVTEISLAERGLKEEKGKLSEIEDRIKKLEEKIDATGVSGIEKERKRRDICVSLAQLFEEAVDVYFNRLRKKVENDATDLFVKLIHEPEYKSLKINENYGLTIVHEDGEEIPVRSAGAEHIVALSLMGALQKNAPLCGPIIMDSPFGRLDDEHKKKVIHALPSIANQVILLIYESEIRPKMARNILKGNLKKEYKMKRISARHTIIESSMGG